MSQQVYGRSREESYAPSYRYGQGANLGPKVPQVVETKQASQKPVVISYYPSGNTNNPQRVIAQVETVTREVVRNPVGAVVEPPVKEIRSHGDQGQLKREDEFVNKLRDETIKATADLNDASRSIQPVYIEPNMDQLHLGHDHVGREEGVPRSIHPRDRHGNGAMSDGWREPYESADPSHPRKVAELVNKVSNWRGANGYDRGKPTSNGYGYSKSYDQIEGYGGDNTCDNSRYGGYGNSRGKLDDSYTGSNKIGEMGYGNRGRLADDHDYTRRNGVNPLAESGYSYTIGSKPPSTQHGYDQYGHNEPRTVTNQGYGYGSYGNNAEENGYGNGSRRNVVNPQAPLAGSGYSYTTGSTSKPLSKQEGYQYGYNEPHVGYNGGGEGSIHKPIASNELGYGYGVDTRNGYGSGLPRSSYVERPIGATSSTVITSVEAVSKYKGTFV